jgi:hypothetical protein
VAQVALDRSDRQRAAGGARLADRLTQGKGLDRIAHRGAGAVRFQVVDVDRGDAGARIHLAQQLGLHRVAGDSQALLVAVGVDPRCGHDRQDPVAVGQRPLEPFQNHDGATLRAHVAVAAGVEHAATAGT